MTEHRDIVWAFGGGVQTICTLTLIAEKQLPKPARATMVDTSRERSLTWQYVNTYAVPLMKSMGMELEIVPHSYATVDLYGKNGDLLIPAYTTNGKLPTFCSNEWKRRPMFRYLAEQGYGPKKPIITWMGMSLDEIERMRISDVKWAKNHYPLIFDVPLRRHECALQIERFGLPIPPKSACWMCPHLDNEEWEQEAELTPEDFAKAVQLEQDVNSKDISNGKDGIWLHKSLVPLDRATFESKELLPMEQLCADVCWT